MKKRILIIVLAIVIGLAGYLGLVSTVHRKEILINEPHSKVRAQLAEIQQVAKWYFPFASKDVSQLGFVKNNQVLLGQNSLSLNKIDASGYWLQASDGANKQMLLFNLLPDTGKTSKVSLEYEGTYFNEFIKGNQLIANATKSLENFNGYFADSKKMYGYSIEITTVTDTAFLFTSEVAAKTTKRKTIQALYQKLINKAAEKNNDYNGTRIFYSSPFGKDSVHLFTGIGISNTANTDVAGDITIKKMPFKMNLLSAFYQGPFNKYNHAIDALSQFKADNNLVSMAIPFIKFITEGIDFTDDQIIQVTACYPVF